MSDLDLSIIVVNWNSMEFLRKCLTSICEHAEDMRYEILAIDNASFDGSREMAGKEFPEVIFIQSEENVGFARANNLAYERSRGRNILFLNPDTEIEGRAIQILLEALEIFPDAGLVGARLLNTDRTLQTTCVTAIPSIANKALASNLLQRVFPRLRLWGMSALYSAVLKVSEVEAISGACMMVKRELLDRIGSFTTDFFMYAEDMDLCIKVRKAGARIYYVPEAVIVHHGGRSSSVHAESNFSSVMQCESLAKFFTKHRGQGYSRMYRASTAIVSAARMVLILLMFPFTLLQKGYQGWSQMASKWLAILAWSLDFSQW